MSVYFIIFYKKRNYLSLLSDSINFIPRRKESINESRNNYLSFLKRTFLYNLSLLTKFFSNLKVSFIKNYFTSTKSGLISLSKIVFACINCSLIDSISLIRYFKMRKWNFYESRMSYCDLNKNLKTFIAWTTSISMIW